KTVYNDSYIGKKDIGLATVNSENDSIKITSIQTDTLAAVNTYDDTTNANPRYFIFRGDASQTYNMISNAGDTAEGIFYIQGRNTVASGYSDVIDAGQYTVDEDSGERLLTGNYSLFNVKSAAELHISNVTIKNAGLITNTNASVLNIDNAGAVVMLNDVILADNKGYAIYNNAGALSLENVSILKSESFSNSNSIYNNDSITTSGVNRFETLVENGTAGTAANALFSTEGVNTFTNNFANYGTLNIGGTDDRFVDISGSGSVNVSGTATVTGAIADSLAVALAPTGKLTLSGENARVSFNNGTDTWEQNAVVMLDGGTLNYELDSNGYFSSTANGGHLNINSGVFTLVSSSTSTNDLNDAVVVTLNSGAALAIGSSEIVNFDENDTIHSSASISLADKATFNIRGITFVDGATSTQNIFNINMDNQISGTVDTTFINSGADMTINANLSAFEGTYRQTSDTTTIVSKDGAIFGGRKEINAGKLYITTGENGIEYTRLFLGDNVEFKNYSTTENGGIINADVLRFSGENAVATFYKDSNLESVDVVDYELASNIANAGKVNTLAFENARVKLTNATATTDVSTTYDYSGETIYSFKNSYINLTNSETWPASALELPLEGTGDIYRFTDLRLDNTRFAIDIDCTKRIFDTIYVTSENASGIIYIDAINWISEPVVDDGQGSPGAMQILHAANDNIQLVLTKDYSWRYTIKDTYQDDDGNISVDYDWYVGGKTLAIGTTNTTNDSIVFEYDRQDLLHELNIYLVGDTANNVKTFSFDGPNQTYIMIENAGVTAGGKFNIVGEKVESDQGSLAVIDAAAKYSLFNLANTTIMTIENIIIQNAVLTEENVNASVFDITNSGVNLTLNNVTLKNNAGVALYNIGGKVTMSDVSFLATGNNTAANSIQNAGGTITASGINVFRTDISNVAGARIFLAGDNTLSSVITNAGVFAIDGNSSISGTINNTGDLYIAGTSTISGTINNSSDMYTGVIPSEMGTASADSSVVFNSNIYNSGTININGKDILNAALTSFEETFGTLNINNELTVTALGSISSDNTVTMADGGVLNIDMGTVYLDTGDSLQGEIVLGATDANVPIDTSSLYYYGLNTTGGTQPKITANSGNLYLEDGTLRITNGDVLSNTVNIELNKGTLDINALADNVELSAGDKWTSDAFVKLTGANLVLSQGLNETSVLDLSTRNQLVGDETSSLTNAGVDLTISADNSAYKGSYTQEKGVGLTKTPTLYVTTTGNVFGGAKNINSGSVIIENEGLITYTGFEIGGTIADKVTFANYSAGGLVDDSVLHFSGESAVATFGKLSTLEDNAEYTLGETNGGGQNNKLVFADSNVTLLTDKGNNIKEYQFDNSLVNLQTDVNGNKYNAYEFGKLTINNSTFAIDVDLTGFVAPAEDGTVTPPTGSFADTITINDITSTGAVVLSRVNFLNLLDQYAQSKIQILTNASNRFYLELSEEIANTTWSYTLADHSIGSIVSINYDDFLGVKAIRTSKYTNASAANDSIEIYNKDINDVLRAINTYDAGQDITREFLMNTADALYVMKTNAGDTAGGIFNIIGAADADGAPTSVIDGASSYSLFNIANTTRMNVSNVEIRNASLTSDDGSQLNASVFDIESPTATVTLNNVVLRANEGNAIYNAGTLSLTNVNVARGSATVANSIVNANRMTLNGTNTFGSAFNNGVTGSITMYGINTFTGVLTNDGIINVVAEAAQNPIVKPEDIINTFGVINNTGTIITSAGSSVFTGEVTNTGSISLGGMDVISANITGAGALNIVSESFDTADAVSTTVTGRGVIDNSVKLNIDEAGTLNIAGGTVNLNQGDSWNGLISLDDSDLDTAVSTLNFSDLSSNGALNATVGNINILSGNLSLKATDVVDDAVSLNITEAGKLTLNGQTAFNLSAGDIWSGRIELQNGSNLTTSNDLTANGALTLGLDNQLTGDNTSVYANNGLTLTISGNQAAFDGTYEQEAGSLTVYANGYNGFMGAAFGGVKNINAGEVTIYSNTDIDYDSYKLAANTTFTNYSTGGNVDSSVVDFQTVASGATARFDTVNADERANYTLSAFNAMGVNTVEFRNSVVSLKNSDYTDKTVYKFGTNTIVDTQDDIYTSYTFDALDTSTNGIALRTQYPSYKIDIDFTSVVENPDAAAPVGNIADTFTVGAQSVGVITLSDIAFNNFDMDYTLGKVQILKGDGVGNDKVSLALSDELAAKTWGKLISDYHIESKGYQVYSDTYIGAKGIRAVAYDETRAVNDSIEIYIIDQDDALKALNTFSTTEARYFLFKPKSEPYYMTVNLGETTAGTLNIVGNHDGSDYVIDGKNPDGADPDTAYSMFVLKNATTLNISDVTLKNAGIYPTTRHNASVIDMYNASATANIRDVVFDANAGYAVYANSGKLNLTNVTFNADANDGNKLFVTGTATLVANGANIFSTSVTNSGANATFSGTNTFETTLSNINNGNMSLSGNSNFIGITGTYGGAIYNNGSTLSVADEAVFESNTATQGGAVYVSGNKVVNIAGTFGGENDKGNTAEQGGAIYITGANNNVTVSGTFLNNTADALGGAIYSDSSFKVVADSSETLFSGNTAAGASNAIYINASSMPTITMNVVNNGTIRFEDAVQGANKYNIAISGGNFDDRVIFNNLVTNADISIENVSVTIDASRLNLQDLGIESSIDGSSIRLNSGALELNTLTLENWTTNDASSATLVVNDTVTPYLTLVNSVVNLSNSTITDLTKNSCDNTYMGILTSDANTKYSIDIAFSDDYTVNEDGTITYNVQNKADTITIAGASTGTVTLSSINFMNVNQTNDGIIQIIKGDQTSSTLTLALGADVQTEWQYTLDDYKSADGILNVLFSDFIGTKNLVLSHTDTSGNIFDSLEIRSNKQDILAAANQYTDSENRNFNFTNRLAKEIYTLTTDTGITASGVMNVNGIANTRTATYEDIIDANKHSMFVVANAGTILNISNLTIQNAVANRINTSHNASVLDIVANDAVVNLTNVIFKNNAGNAIYNMGSVVLNGVTIELAGGDIYNAGTMSFVSGNNTINTSLTNTSNIVLGTDTGAISNNTFNGVVTNNSVIESKIGTTNTYNGSIVTTDGAEFNFGGNDVIDSEIILNSANDVATFNITGTTTVAQNSGMVDNNLSINVADGGTLKFLGSSALFDVTVNDTWAETAVIALENFVNPADTADVSEAYLKYVGADASGSNGIINAVSGRFELVSGVFDILAGSTIADDVNVILTSGALGVNRSGITLASGDVWSDKTKVMLADGVTFTIGSGLNDNSVLNITETSTLLGDTDNNSSPNAKFVNNGVTVNVLVDESELYKGQYIQTAGSLVIENDGVNKFGKVFGEYVTQDADGKDVASHSLKDIQGGSMIVNYTNDAINYGNVKLGNNATLINTTVGGVVNTELLSFGGTGAVAKFISANADAVYTLQAVDSLANSRNTIVFEDSNVTLLDKSFRPASSRNGVTAYEFNNSVVNLQNGNVEATPDTPATVDLSNYYFSSFSLNNSTFVLDVDLNKSTLRADTLEIAAVANPDSDNTIKLADLNFINVDQSNIGKIQILRNKIDAVTLALDSVLADTTWEYYVDDAMRVTQDADGNDIVQIKFTDFLGIKAIRLANYRDDASTNYDSIEIYNSITYDLLQQINHFDTPNNVTSRQFAFTADGQTYTMTESLGLTGYGKFDIVGMRSRDGMYSIIDGTNNHYSMFELSNDTQMSVLNVTFANAGLNGNSGNASVFDISNNAATLDLTNVRFNANSGDAIYNNGGTITMKNVVFDAATKDADGNVTAANSIKNYSTITTTVDKGTMTNNIFNSAIVNNTGAIFEFHATDTIAGNIINDGEMRFYGIDVIEAANDGSAFDNVGTIKTAVGLTGVNNVSVTFNRVIDNKGIIETLGNDYFNANINNTGSIFFGGTEQVAGVISGENGKIVIDTIGTSIQTPVVSVVANGEIDFNQQLTLANGANLNVDGGIVNLDNNTDTADVWDGTVTLNAGTLNLAGIENNGDFVGNAGSVNIIEDAVLNITNTVNNNVNVNLADGTIKMTGTSPVRTGSMTLSNGDKWMSGTTDIVFGRYSALTLDSGLNGDSSMVLEANQIATIAGDATAVSTARLNNMGVDLTVNGDNSAFEGTYYQGSNVTGTTYIHNPSLTLTADGIIFNGIKNIYAGKVDITRNELIDYNNFRLGDNATFINKSKGGTVDSNVISFVGTAVGAVATFTNFDNSVDSDKADYTLYNITNINPSNKIVFSNSNVTFASYNNVNGYYDYSGTTIYEFNNSNIDLGKNDNGLIKDYQFTTLVSDNTNDFTIDLDFGLFTLNEDATTTVTKAATADTLTLGANSSGVVKLSSINFINDTQYDNCTITIIKTASSNIELALTNELVADFESNHTYEISDAIFVVDDKVQIDYAEYLGTKGI
ncbi:MAG: hypothetical protein NC200_02085, partial [Candidatus Gastranaerophilales bacterium]|nr:hypothetical protein [Candidatus Gastranaerophilales bacterium]